MPDQNTDAESALRKLGQRLRQGWAKKHPTTEKTIDTIKDTVREQWEQEQQATRSQPLKPGPTKDQQKKPPEPEQER